MSIIVKNKNGEEFTVAGAGKNGTNGKSAYQIAVDNGYTGTEAEWLASLKGQDGADGTDGAGVPSGGAVGKFLKKKTDNDFDTEWGDVDLTADEVTGVLPVTKGGTGGTIWPSNPNLLDNWYFADPINQRGLTEYTASGYTIDRWKNSLIDKVEIFEDYISLSVSSTSNAYANWGQLLPFNFKELGLITLSVMYKNPSQTSTIAIYDAKGTWKTSTDMPASTVWNIVSLTISDNSPEAIKAQLYPTVAGQALAGTLEIRAMKLELGPVQTLAHKDENGNWILNDPPPNKALELAKCQRYFERLYLPRGFILFNNKTNSLVANLFYTPKRTTPTITAQSMYVVRVSDNTGVYGPFVFTTPEFIDSPSKNGCVMNFGDAQVNTIGVGFTAYIADESYIDISADL